MGSIAICLTFLLIIVAIMHLMVEYLKRWKLFNKIHGPRAYPLIGNAHQLRRDYRDFFEQIIGTCSMFESPRMLRVWLGCTPVVLLFGAEEAEALLADNKQLEKADQYFALHPWLGTGLLTSSSQKWRPRRKLLTPSFHYDILKDFLLVFNSQSQILVERIRSLLNDNKRSYTLDLSPLITHCALDIICESAMGNSFEAQSHSDSDYVKAVYKINDIIHERQMKPWLSNDYIFKYFGRGMEHDECLRILHCFTWKVINERNDSTGKQASEGFIVGGRGGLKKKKLAFMDLLLDLYHQGHISLVDIREEVDTFMFEGHDTTATALNWLILLLGSNPDQLQKAVAEVDEIFGTSDREVTMDDVTKMKYLDCCIKEALRLFPSVPIYARTLSRALKIGSHEIPKGYQVAVVPYMVHRDSRHWEDPEIFHPERFFQKNMAGRHPYSFVPFSAGSRNCIGQKFALIEEKTVISWLLRKYKIRSVKRRDQIRPTAELILRPKEGVLVEISPR